VFQGFSAARRARVLRWLLVCGLSYMFATFVVLIGLTLLPRDMQMSLTEAAVAWVVLGLAVLLVTVFARRTRAQHKS
jgi:positive regulator of sigma E activity